MTRAETIEAMCMAYFDGFGLLDERFKRNRRERMGRALDAAATRPPADVVACECGEGEVPQCDAVAWNGDRCLLPKARFHSYHKGGHSGWSAEQ